MALDDDFGMDDYTSMSEDGFDGAGPETLPEQLMRKLPFIFLGFVALMVVVFLLQTFVGTQVDVTITIKNLENEFITNNNLLVSQDGLTEPVFRASGESSYTFTAKAGSYSASVIVPGYRTQLQAIEITPDDTEFIFLVEKDIPANLSVVSNITGAIGQTLQIPVTVTNSSSTQIDNVEVLLKDISDKSITVTIEPKQLSVPGNASAQASLNVSIPSAFELGRNSSQEVTGTIQIKYTKQSVPFKFIVNPRPELDVTPRNISFRANAAEQTKTTLTFKNKGKTGLGNVDLSIEVLNAGAHDKEAVRDWFVFPSSGSNTLTVSDLATNENRAIDLIVQIPENAKIDTITGNLVITSDNLPEVLKRTISLEVLKEVNVQLTLQASSDTIQVPFDAEAAKYKKVLDKKITVKNAGDIKIESINIRVQNRDICTETWLSFSSTTQIRELAAGEEKPIFIEVTAPANARGDEKVVVCEVVANYFDSIQEIQKQTDTPLRIIPAQ